MTNKLEQLFLLLARLPGMGFMKGYASTIQAKQHQVAGYRLQAEQMRDDAVAAKDGIGDLAGGGEGGDDAMGGPAQGGMGGAMNAMPAGGGDSTVIRPRPGGQGPAFAAAPAAVPQQAARIVGSGLNPLVDAATALFALVGQIRGTSSHPNADALRNHVVQQMQAFDAAARNAGASPEAVLAARYSLCTLIDETAMSTPWAMESHWSHQSILSTFHNEVFGGEKFFQMLNHVVQEPARNLELLEFMYVCIALGLEGRYRVIERGRAQLEQVQDNLYQAIRRQRGDFERELSPRWRGVEDKRSRLVRYVPLWVVGALAGVLLFAVYFGFSYMLNRTSDPVFAELGAIGRSARAEPAPPAPPVERTLTLREVLADDISAGRVDVEERSEGTQIRIRGDGLFDSGSANVSQQFLPLIGRIGQALEQFPGAIQVTGHTDNTPMSVRMQVRFPSNWHLSQKRAESVVKVLSGEVSDGSRLNAEGRGDTEPVTSNDTREGRARNRRVEITLLSHGRSS